MGKQLPVVTSGPNPIGPYSIATEVNGLVFISGQVALDPDTNQPIEGDVRVQTRRILENLTAILGELGLTLDAVVKTTVFLADMGDFPLFNDVYGEFFVSDQPARSTVEVSALPGGFQVEIEAIAAR